MATIDTFVAHNAKPLVIILLGLLMLGGGIVLSQNTTNGVEIIPQPSSSPLGQQSIVQLKERSMRLVCIHLPREIEYLPHLKKQEGTLMRQIPNGYPGQSIEQPN